MAKKTALVLGFLMFVNGTIFADNEENRLPKNIITVDMGLTLPSFVVWGITGFTFFGTAIQYERQILEKVSTIGRLDYRGISISGYDYKTSMSSISLEGHGRYYPEQGAFFLDGMLGYAVFSYSSGVNEPANLSHYFKLGGKFGWRIDFGKPGGLIFEPSFGYYGAIGRTYIEFIKDAGEVGGFFNQWLNQYFNYIVKGYFVGGPQFSLGLGYRF